MYNFKNTAFFMSDTALCLPIACHPVPELHISLHFSLKYFIHVNNALFHFNWHGSCSYIGIRK